MKATSKLPEAVKAQLREGVAPELIWLDPQPAADFLQKSKRTLAEWRLKRRNHPLKFSRSGNAVTYRLSDLIAYREGGAA
jgi:hypothetical protein